jgi:hypothetical protein
VVHMRVPAPGHIFHEAHVTGAKHGPGPITGANLDFAGQMHDQPAFRQGVEVHLSGPVKLLYLDSWIFVNAPKAGCSSKRSASLWLSPSLPANRR